MKKATMGTTFEDQLQSLANCGIRLVPEVTPDCLIQAHDRSAFESEPFVLLLCAMGAELDVEPYVFPSDAIWHFDAECIEDHNDYVRIAQRLSDLAAGDLPLDEVNDFVDVEESDAWVSFRIDGKTVKWEAEVDNDWVDATILSRFAELLRSRGTGRRYTYLDLDGQDCLIGCATPEMLEELRSTTGLDFVWLV